MIPGEPFKNEIEISFETDCLGFSEITFKTKIEFYSLDRVTITARLCTVIVFFAFRALLRHY